MKYRFILFDADNTLLDFNKSEEAAFHETINSFGYKTDSNMYLRYSKINDELWKELEKRKITKDELVIERYRRFLNEFNINLNPSEVNGTYVQNLQNKYFLIPEALDVVKALSEKYELYIITNGIYKVQTNRLINSGLINYVKDYFVSEKIGYSKPSKEYFDYVEKSIEGFIKDKALVVGDSLTSDIKGANNAGIKSCWYNPQKIKNDTDATPDYEISNLKELFDIL